MLNRKEINQILSSDEFLMGVEFEFYLPMFADGYTFDETWSDWDYLIEELEEWSIDMYDEDIPEFPNTLSYFIKTICNEDISFYNYNNLKENYDSIIDKIIKLEPKEGNFKEVPATTSFNIFDTDDIISERYEFLREVKSFIEPKLNIFLLIDKSPKLDDVFWGLTTDPTVPFEEGGIELISPPLPLKESISYCNDIFEFIKEHGVTSEKTGIHFHISIKNKKLNDSFNITKFLLFNSEEYIYKFFENRIDNEFAESVKELLNINIYETPLKTSMYLNLETKKLGVNFKYLVDNHLEFRYIGGSGYETKIRYIKLILANFLYNVKIASDIHLEKNKFLKKMVKWSSYVSKNV